MCDTKFAMRVTIHVRLQVGIFGGYTRWAADIQPPSDTIPARTMLTTIDTAVRRATGERPGPVHLNCQFREPLAPVPVPWDERCLQGLEHWETSGRPFTTHVTAPESSASGEQSAAMVEAVHAVLRAKRGLILVAELPHPADAAAAVTLAQALGWPVVTDVLSGLRIGSAPPAGSPAALLTHFDHVLLEKNVWGDVAPDVVLQLGGRLTSKRVAQFVESCCLGQTRSAGSNHGTDHAQAGCVTEWVSVERTPTRHDQSHLLRWRIQAGVPTFAAALAAQQPTARPVALATQAAYTALLCALDMEAWTAIDAELATVAPQLTEPHVARLLARALPPGEALFLGNSMPIRDFDAYGTPSASAARVDSATPRSVYTQSRQFSGVGAAVAANRGASGIDGVLSTAAGFADGLGRGCTLVVGDLSFLHDINGLNLLRNGESRSPLTVVLINNGGGGIFSFLPIADELPEDEFTPLWATPQNVDLAGMQHELK
jgi:isochorismate synthase/2-succinyl-5-enolpyruvyl-6-hydroxy-3-cyclohexene-1-carboxylate synthase/2-succinyl-6-hydroxy-2,4-cyclohexadiene-1-carboxylate synthase/O-succinylbenzoate synthase